MSEQGPDARYDEAARVIEVNGTVVIDLSAVRKNAAVTIRSRLVAEHQPVHTTMTITRGLRPFHFGSFTLGPNGLLAVAVENQLEIEGMKLGHDIETAYERVWGKGRLQRLIGRSGDRDNTGAHPARA